MLYMLKTVPGVAAVVVVVGAAAVVVPVQERKHNSVRLKTVT